MAKKRGRPKKDNIEEVEIEAEKTTDEPTNEQMTETIKETKEEVSEVADTTKTSDSNIVGEGTFSDYNPFSESVVQRDYSTPQVASGLVEDIDEPQFVPPSYEDIINGSSETEGDIEDTGNPFDNPNPAFNDLENKDKKIACESMVDTCLDAYEQLHKYAQFIVKVDEEDLLERHQSGKIDLQEIIPVSENGDTMTISEFMQQYNQQGQEALTYDKDFGFKVRPAMVRVFMKKGWGMSDEQYLMYMFGKDLAVKAGIMFQLKKTINSTLEALEKNHKGNSNRGREREMEEFDEEDMNEQQSAPTNAPEPPRASIIMEEQEIPYAEDVSDSHTIDMPERKTPTILPKEVARDRGRHKKKNND